MDDEDDDEDIHEEDEVVVANTRANSLTNVAQYSKIAAAVKGEDVPKPPTSMKGKSSLAIAAAATSIMFSMPAQVSKNYIYCVNYDIRVLFL